LKDDSLALMMPATVTTGHFRIFSNFAEK